VLELSDYGSLKKRLKVFPDILQKEVSELLDVLSVFTNGVNRMITKPKATMPYRHQLNHFDKLYAVDWFIKDEWMGERSISLDITHHAAPHEFKRTML
jgi:hypothetical protein